MSTANVGPIDAVIAGEAAEWLVRLHSGRFTEADRLACDRWRQRSPEHDRAWHRALAVLDKFGGLPQGLGRASLEAAKSRRAVLRGLAGLIAVLPAGWLAWKVAPWQAWAADYATDSGQRQRFQLPDGTLLTLNTASAVDLAYDDSLRLLRLRRGEVLVRTSHAADPRPLVLRSAEGAVQALGTVFTVRQFDARTRVAVLDGRVRISPDGGTAAVLEAGRCTDFSATSVEPPWTPAHSPGAWEEGALYADDWRLADFVQELGRYRPGVLRCDPAVGELRISGGFQLDDTDAVLLAVARSLPIKVVYRSRYWVTVTAA
ncbi:FecR domain-containing protein [Achromobacter marplatensis]|uniref:FecR family protein n=1 Tax=Achromobacter marplatensis TaxID=470868 RepID=A0AA43B145_9BURK|nr:FecR family protein [Achromobacter marplatensis]MDH2050447.1 FecR family protein [Achromobacter marplatensis]